MRRGFGAIFTTGAALVGATIVVANPVSAPPSDVRVPPVKLSMDSTASSAALDQALLETIAKNPAETTPANLFKKSVAGVVTNVTLLSGRAVEGALRVRPVVDGTPAPMPPPPVPSTAVVDLLGGRQVNVSAAKVPAAPVEDPALQHTVSSVADYVGYVSVRAVEATDAAGTIGAAEPKQIADTLAQLTHGDVNSSITTALRTAVAPVGPPSMVVKAIRAGVRQQLTELADRIRRSLPTPPRISPLIRPSNTKRPMSLRATLGHRRAAATPPTSAAVAASSDQTDRDQQKPTTVNGATDLSDGNKAVPATKAAQPQLRQRAEASLNQARSSLERLGDVLRKALPAPPTLPKLPRPHRAHRR
ncbi:hypothetical protein [Mycolicibacterium vinylchloridicum]|uniref:hypothetical protein n=1 Tax=Mycolicibacterium vinylchloridicum TaxID=2736928 RepID=UPI0015C986DE|nr:hypothetical protein [Mycolicibacterium vinylchloridicum]